MNASRFQQGENLNCLTEPHVICKAATEAELLEKREPTEPFLLVRPQCTGETFGWIDCADALKACQLVARLLKPSIELHFGLGSQHRIQQARLILAEPKMAGLRSSKLREQSIFFQPF